MKGKREGYDCARSLLVLKPHFPPVRLDKRAHDIKAETEAAFHPRHLALRELLEKPLPIAGRDARSLVLDPDYRLGIVDIAVYGDEGTGRAEMDGVVEKVDDDLFDFVPVRV